jgi:hypothetical protein
MLRVDGVAEAMRAFFQQEQQRILNAVAREACSQFGVDATAEPVVYLADSLLLVFDRQYSECLGPACYAVAGDLPERHPARNMIFSLGACDQHPHFEINETGERDRLFGVVGFNVPSHSGPSGEAPAEVMSTVILDVADCNDWHDGRQVNPERCGEFVPLVVREDVVHHGVCSGSDGHVRIALHQAFSSEASQWFYFSFTQWRGAPMSVVAAACLRQPDWILRDCDDDFVDEVQDCIRRGNAKSLKERRAVDRTLSVSGSRPLDRFRRSTIMALARVKSS